MENIIVDFILKGNSGGGGSDVDYYNTVQTGDTFLIVLGIILTFIAAFLFYISYRETYIHSSAHAELKNHISMSFCSKKIINIASVFIATCALIIMTFAFCNGAIAQPNDEINNSEVHNAAPGHINAYVDSQTGSVTFDKIKHTISHDVGIKSFTIGLLDGIDDGACNWIIKNDGEILFNDVADGIVHKLDIPIQLDDGEYVELELGSTITPEYALALAGKSVLSISFEVAPLNTLSWGEGIINVVDEYGATINNGQNVVAGTRLFATADDFDTFNYTFNMQESNGITEKDFATGYTADFYMPENQLFITANKNNKEFYATFNYENDEGNLNFYYKDITNQQTNDGTTFHQNEFSFDKAVWPYRDDEYREKITNITIDSSVGNFYGFKSTNNMFKGLKKALSITGAEFLQTENVTNMGSMFYYTGYNVFMNNVPDVSKWNTSNVTDMSYLFYFYSASISFTSNAEFNLVPDVSKWDTSKVTNMSFMFGCYGDHSTTLTLVPDVSNWNTSKVLYFVGMFSNYGSSSKSLSSVPDVSGWDTSSVKDMNSMFTYYAMDSFYISSVPDVSEWNTINLESTHGMFKMYAGHGENHEEVTFNCVPDISGWNTLKLKNTSEMFCLYAYGRKYVDVFPDFSGWDTKNVTDMGRMFDAYAYNSTNVNQILFDLSSFDTSIVESYDNMLSNYNGTLPLSIEKIKIGKNWNLSMVIANPMNKNWKINNGETIVGLDNLDHALKTLDEEDFPVMLIADKEAEFVNGDACITEGEDVDDEAFEESEEFEYENNEFFDQEDNVALQDFVEANAEEFVENANEVQEMYNAFLFYINLFFF